MQALFTDNSFKLFSSLSFTLVQITNTLTFYNQNVMLVITMQIVFLFYPGMTALDAVGPHEILSRLPATITKRVAIERGGIQTDSDLILTADYSISEVNNADVLLIPGSGKATALQAFPDIISWIQNIHKHTTWTTSVCTGSLILGAAGLLTNIKATSHWAALNRLNHWGAIPTARIVEDGKIITAAGVSAGIDMALTLAAKIAGQGFAEALQLGIEYDPEPPFQSGSPKEASPELLKTLRARMESSFEKIK